MSQDARLQAVIDRAHAVHGRTAVYTKQSTGGTTTLTALLSVDETGLGAVVSLKEEDLASEPLEHDYLVFSGSSVKWFVVRRMDVVGLRGDYRLECASNAAE